MIFDFIRSDGKVVFPVLFTPDCVKSGLVAIIENFIYNKTKLKPSFYFWRTMDITTIENLYVDIAHSTSSWPLIVSLFLSAPTFCAIYLLEGNAVQPLTALKGNKHPAEALRQTIRGSFWCDNAICNLVHMSDNMETAKREISLLAGGSKAISTQIDSSLMNFASAPRKRIMHSGILMLYSKLVDIFKPELTVSINDSIPESGSSQETFFIIRKMLEELTSRSYQIKKMVEKYFSGQGDSLVRDLETLNPLSNWEKLVIESGCYSIVGWNETKNTLEEVMKELERKFGLHQWIIGGSAALKMYGLDVDPADIDVRCSKKTLLAISKQLGKQMIKESSSDYAADVIRITLLGWDVEFVGDLEFENGVRVAVDEEMLTKTRPNHAVQSVEDLLAEFLVMNRQTAKKDLHKAQMLFKTFQHGLDLTYLSERMRKWRINPEILNYLCNQQTILSAS